MGGFGVMDFMVKSFRNNRRLLKGRRKSIKEIYQDHNLNYIKKRVQERTREFDPEKKKIFLEKFYSRQRTVQKRLAILLTFVITIFTIILYRILSSI